MESTDLLDGIKENTPESNAYVTGFLAGKNLYDLRWPDGETVLHWAAAHGNSHICMHVLELHDFHPNINNYRGTSPLYYAVIDDHEDIVRILLQYGANPCVRSGFSGLMPADATKSETIRKIIHEEEERLVPIVYPSKCSHNAYPLRKGFTRYHAYKYRVYMYWLSSFEYLANGYPSKCGLQDLGNARAAELYKQGSETLADHCKKLYAEYLASIPDKKVDGCLACGTTKNTKLCTGCRGVRFCNKDCQTVAFSLHKFDCRA